MTRSKGKTSPSLLCRAAPYGVLVLADSVLGKVQDDVVVFHNTIGIPIKARAIYKGDIWYGLYCFANKGQATMFQVNFGGHMVSE